MSDDYKILLGYQTMSESTTIKLDFTNNKVFLNNKPIKMEAKRLCRQIVSTVSSWENEMTDNSTLDGVEYYVKIQKDKKIYSYVGANKFPDNFNDFLTLICEVKNYGAKV